MMPPNSGREWPPRPRNERPPPAPPGPDPRVPYPDVRSAFMLTLFAMLAAAFTGVLFIDFGLLAAVGVGQAIGVGAVATMAAQRVPEPQARRLGLRTLERGSLPAILCLAPAILLASELDNIARDGTWAGSGLEHAVELEFEPGDAPDDSAGSSRRAARDAASEEAAAPAASDGLAAEESPGSANQLADGEPIFDPNDPFSLLQAFIVLVGISPIVEEFLFRGVIQQGIVARLGLMRGVALVALLWTLLRPAPLGSLSRFFAAALASFALGWLLGMVRIATRSILGPILLAASWGAVGLVSLAVEGEIDLPGMNVEDTHLPVSVTIASVLLVAWAGKMVFEEAQRVFAADQHALAGTSPPESQSGPPDPDDQVPPS